MWEQVTIGVLSQMLLLLTLEILKIEVNLMFSLVLELSVVWMTKMVTPLSVAVEEGVERVVDLLGSGGDLLRAPQL